MIPRIAALAAALIVGAPTALAAQPEAHCVGAHRFVSEAQGMAAVTEPDTIDDWRTGRTVVGCRVTAAGVTDREMRAEAVLFFGALRDAGWTRTPDARDAPNEASLRFRRDGADCLFSFYTGGLLGTEAEAIVTDARVPGPGQGRYFFAVQCMPAAPAAPRGDGAGMTASVGDGAGVTASVGDGAGVTASVGDAAMGMGP